MNCPQMNSFSAAFFVASDNDCLQVLCNLRAAVPVACQQFVTILRSSNFPGPIGLFSLASSPEPLAHEESHVEQTISPSRNGQKDSDLRNRLRAFGVRTPQRSTSPSRSANRQASRVRYLRETGSPSPEGATDPNPAYSCLAARPSGLASQKFNLASTHEGMSLPWLHVGAGHVADSPLSQAVPGESVCVSVPSPDFPQQEIQESLA